MDIWTFERGETIAVPVLAAGSTQDLAQLGDWTVTAVLKRAVFNGPPAGSAASVASFTIAPLAGDAGPGWLLTIAATVAATLTPGTYVTNAVAARGDGHVIKSPAVLISIVEAT